MPIVSRIGRRSLKVRLLYCALFLVLIVGAVTMIYPFLLMVTGSVKSEADLYDIAPIPRYLFDDGALFTKYVESKYNNDLRVLEACWQRPILSWESIERPEEQEFELLEEFLKWRAQSDPRWWWLGHTRGGRLLPENAREFRSLMQRRYDEDVNVFRKAMSIPVKAWTDVSPPHERALLRYALEPQGLMKALREFAETRPACDRAFDNPDGDFWRNCLLPQYTSDVSAYNRAHPDDPPHADYRDVFLSRKIPAGKQQREDWEKYVREMIRLTLVRLSPELTGNFQRFLAGKYDKDIRLYNSNPGRRKKYDDFGDVILTKIAPESRIDQVDWEDFLKDRQACPAEGIEVYGPRQSFEEFVAERRGGGAQRVGPLPLPVAAADWHDCMANAGSLRWEFTTRNYHQVLGYILLHGNGIRNTAIYCILIIALTLVVNPMAAYALSRYKPPSTYKVLLFCMATMAFPGEVTMIPGFLLLKRFPLWPLLGGGAAFAIAAWLSGKFCRKLSEQWRMLLALGVGLSVGGLLIPMAILQGRSHVSLLNTFAALVLPGMANGYMIFLLKGFFDSIPRELYEAADLDGASEWTKFWSFTMALSKPILAVLALGAFNMAYSQFMMALIIIPDPDMWTLMVWIFQLQSEAHQAVVYASLVMGAVPTLLVFVLCQGVIMRGIIVPVEK